MNDTIFAVSSGRPPAAIAVIRISGPQALAATRALCGDLPAPRYAAVRALRDGDRLLDRALVLTFPGPATATGEDLAELHCHGGRAVIAAVERTLAALPGLRPAEAGEFTRRALINGRMDLTEAEGLADLLEAETETQRIAALRGADGAISRMVRGWMDRTAALSAEVEALLDFSDEGDVVTSDLGVESLSAAARTLGDEIATVAAMPSVDRLRDGLRVVIAGPPNSGKSTLLNLLGDRDAAIVSPVSGTTRDRIEVSVARDGLPYILIDTAGLTELTDDPVERVGVSRAEQAIVDADLLLWLGETDPPRRDAIWVHARSDVAGRAVMPEGREIAVSERHPVSILALWDRIAARASMLVPQTDAVAINGRQRRLAIEAATALQDVTGDSLILAENLRTARQAFASLLGIDATATMLDALFSRFCIGK